ncbi:hypothetical protein MMC28_004535 [Mycoblastus sanguinarius]|nr:hypothetical protein [Mycoblastus sanguinarius]
MAPEGDTPPPPEFALWEQALRDEIPQSLEPSFEFKYDFRIAAREKKTALCAWVDQDESGTYDPDGKAEPVSVPIKRQRERIEQSDDRTSKKPKTNTWQYGRFASSRLPVTLKITSEQGKRWLRSVGTALDNWPQPTPDPGSSDESPPHWSELWTSSFNESNSLGPRPYVLRKRSGNSSTHNSSFQGCGPRNIEDITIGHPAARGCKACFVLGSSCPLLYEGARYPCKTCVEDDIDCELIAEPVVKGKCVHCRKKKQVCTFDDRKIDHKGPCAQCNNKHIKCIAGPASGWTSTGPALDQSLLHRMTTKTRTDMKSCTPCGLAKKRCSFMGKKKRVPCSYCRENGVSCTFEVSEPLIPRAKKSTATHAGVTDDGLNPETTTDQESTTRSKVITTKLAHPITFNYHSDDFDKSTACHWCDDEVYGLLGIAEIEVEVIDNGDGRGYIEIDDGHTAAGYPPSRMCEYCTLERLRITACNIHEIEPIEGMDPENFDYTSITEWILPGMASSAPFAWCSVCPTPAFFACCAKMDTYMEGQDTEICGGDVKGCGLLLCKSCAVTLVNKHDGILRGLIDRLKTDKVEGEFGLRADADFLHPKGELLRRMENGALFGWRS